jgi:hypothetical protein
MTLSLNSLRWRSGAGTAADLGWSAGDVMTSSHAAVEAITGLSDAQCTQCLYATVIWLIGAASAGREISPQMMLDQITAFADQYPGGRWQSPPATTERGEDA